MPISPDRWQVEAHSCVRGNLFIHSFTQPICANLLMHQVLCEELWGKSGEQDRDVASFMELCEVWEEWRTR